MTTRHIYHYCATIHPAPETLNANILDGIALMAELIENMDDYAKLKAEILKLDSFEDRGISITSLSYLGKETAEN